MADKTGRPLPDCERPVASETTALLSGDDAIVVDSTASTSTTPRKDSWTGDLDYAGQPRWRRPSVYWLIPPYLLFTLAFGGVLVPRLNLIISLVCRRYFADRTAHAGDGLSALLPVVGVVVPGADNPQCQIPAVQRSVSMFTLAISVTTGSLSAFSAPRLGALSDRLGRKGIMVLASSGGLAGEIITILAAHFPDVIHYHWLIAAAVLDGLAGSFTVGSVVSHSYASDCTPPSRRAVAFGYMHACLFAGMAFGPLLAGFFVRWSGSLLSLFYVALACHLLFILYILLVLPESLSPRQQRLAQERHARAKAKDRLEAGEPAPVPSSSPGPDSLRRRLLRLPRRRQLRRFLRSNPLRPLQILLPPGAAAARVRRNLVLLATIDTMLLAAGMSMTGVTLLYSEYAFHWGNFETSLFLSLVSMVRVVVLMAIFPVMNYVFRVRPAAAARRLSEQAGASPANPSETPTGGDRLDVWLIRSAILSDMLGVAGYVFARTPALFVVSGVVTALGGLGSATVQSTLTKHVPPDRVGQLLGAIGLLHSLSRAFAPLLFNGLYAATVATFPRATFVLVTVVFAAIFVLSLFVRPHVFLSEADDEPEPLNAQAQGELLAEDEVVPQI